MAIRITQNQTTLGFAGNLQSIYAQMAKSQQQIADGRAITKPSDDPFGTGQVIDYDAQLADVKQFQTNVTNATGVLGSADSALDTMTSALQKIKTLAVQAENGTPSAQDLNNIAIEMGQLKEVVRDGLNAQHGGQYIFGGTSTKAAPFPAPANTYMGTTNPLQSRVTATQTVQVSVPGDTVAGISPTNVLDDIDALITAVQSGNSATMNTAASAVYSDTDRVIDIRAQLGATASRLEATQTRLEAQEERLMDARSKVAEVDSAQAFLDMSKQQTMYQAALASGTKIMSTTILDYIR
ncbi:MAG: flagellar hook-associated protein 3 [Thermoleophilia bacterium]|nr:flagellar hook-associated protein 3 [Thermoleophilia bacterium]